LPGGDTFAALLVNLMLGAAFIILVGLLAREWFGVRFAGRAMVVLALFPGSFVLSFAYSEALLLTLAAACLLALQREKWLIAGLLAALATSARPNGVALIVACAVAAGFAIHQKRHWRALIAPALAPTGFLAFQLWIDSHTEESRAWFRVQGEAWKEGASFGLTALRRTTEAFTQPLTSPTDLITAVSFMSTLLVVWIAWRRHRIPAFAAAYSAVIVALMLLPSTVTARPRFLFTAFPLLIAAAVWLDHPRREKWWPYLVGSGLVGLTTLTALYGVYAAIP
jgi:4-amino-4-deoxy-L-arabinose transferase-like glycosyltransferase